MSKPEKSDKLLNIGAQALVARPGALAVGIVLALSDVNGRPWYVVRITDGNIDMFLEGDECKVDPKHVTRWD